MDPMGRRKLTTVRLVLATGCAVAAILINDHYGWLGDVGVAVLAFGTMWLIVEEAVARLQAALHRAFPRDGEYGGRRVGRSQADHQGADSHDGDGSARLT